MYAFENFASANVVHNFSHLVYAKHNHLNDCVSGCAWINFYMFSTIFYRNSTIRGGYVRPVQMTVFGILFDYEFKTSIFTDRCNLLRMRLVNFKVRRSWVFGLCVAVVASGCTRGLLHNAYA